MIKLKKYTLNPKLFLFLIPIIISIGLFITVIITAENIIALIVGLITSIGALITTLIVLLNIIFAEYKLWKTAIFHNKNILIRTEGLDSVEDINSSIWANNINEPIIKIMKKLTPYVNIDKRKLEFYIIDIKKHAVSYIRGVKIEAKGLSARERCQIQYNEPNVMNSLLEHELAHLVLNSMGYEDKGEEWHHEIMLKAGIK